jgi:ribosomal protein S18 acetylase RimI-like enzyme
MHDATPTASMAASRDSIGLRAARHFELSFREFTAGRGAELGPNYLRWVTREAHPLGNVALVSGAGGRDDARAAALPLVTREFPSAALFPEGVSADVAQSLQALGFEGQGEIPAMAVDIPRVAATALPPSYSLTRVGEGGGGQAWAEALAIGYGLPPGLARRFSPEVLGADMAADARTQYFSIVRDGRTVATSLLFLADGLAGIYCVATLPEERGRGLGAHATAEPLRIAQRQGYRVGVLQSSTAGHPVYLRLGFEDVGGIPMFVRMPR